MCPSANCCSKCCQVLPTIPEDQVNGVARFLEQRGEVDMALEIATDPDYRFELAVQLGKLDIAQVCCQTPLGT